MSAWSRRVVQIERWSATLAGIGFGLVLAFIGNHVSETQVPWVAILALVCWVFAVLVRRFLPKRIEVTTRTPLSLRNEHECAANARQAYIGFVPLYTPKYGASGAKLTAEERKEAVKLLDFDRLNLEDSNLEPTITAIVCHKSRLEHCWLLSTVDAAGEGSSQYAELLAEYLRQRKGVKCIFHCGSQYTINLDDDALVFDKTYQKVWDVIQEAKGARIPAKEMVADISTGVRSMTIGMVLACLDGDQDVEVVGTRYDANGHPTGPLFPLIFRFKPEIQET